MSEFVLLYITFPSSEEARKTAQALLEARLIACANIMQPVESHYRWEGALTQENEVVMTAKTTAKLAQEATVFVKNLHSYELPCIIALPIDGGFPPFLQWVAAETLQK